MKIFAILIFALVLRLPLLNGSFWLDEAAQALESSRPLAEQHLIRADFQPPLLHYLTHFSLYFSNSEWWLRSIGALLPGLVTIYVFYLLAKKWFSDRVATWSTLLLVTSSFHIFFSQELRPYSLPAMFALLSWYFLNELVMVKKKSAKITVTNLVSFTISTILGLYASYLYPFVALAQAIWILVLHRQHWQKFLTTGIISALAFLPWLPSFLGQLQEGGSVREQLPGWDQVVSLTQGKALFLTIGKFIFGMIKIDLNPVVFLTTLVLSLISLCLIKDFYEQFQKQKDVFQANKKKIISILTIFFLPLLMAWLVSFVVPVLSPKRVLYLLPFFYLVAASLLDFLPKKKAPLVLIATLLILNITTTANYYFDESLHRENWRDLHTQIVNRFGHRQAIAVFSHPDVFSPWRWYDDGNFPTLATGTLSVSQIPDLRAHFKVVSNYQYVLVFDYLRTLSDPQDLILKEIVSYGFKEIEVIDTPNIGFVRIYGRPETVLSSRQLEN